MCKSMKVLISDDGSDFSEACRNALTQKGYHVVCCGREGGCVLSLIQDECPDVVVMNLYMRQMDALSVLENLGENRPRLIILLTPFIDSVTSQIFAQRKQDTSNCHPMLLPVRLDALLKRIDRLCTMQQSDPSAQDMQMTRMLTDLLHRFGMPAHISGHTYLRCSIELAIENPNILRGITTQLYPKLAKQFHSTPSRVERAIRHAIEIAWTRGDISLLEQVFSYTVSDSRGRPTNSEFIAMLADYVRLNEEALRMLG